MKSKRYPQVKINSPKFVELTSVINKSLGLPENWNFLQSPANQVFPFVLLDPTRTASDSNFRPEFQ